MVLTKNALITLFATCVLQASAVNIKLITFDSGNKTSLNTVCAMVGACDYGCDSASTLSVTLSKGNTTSCNSRAAGRYPNTLDITNDVTSPSVNVSDTTVTCKLKKAVTKRENTTRKFSCIYTPHKNDTTPSTTTTLGDAATTTTVLPSDSATDNAIADPTTTTTVSEVRPTATMSLPHDDHTSVNATGSAAESTAAESATATGTATDSTATDSTATESATITATTTTTEPTSTPGANCQKVANIAGTFSGQAGDCCLKNKDCRGKCVDGVCKDKRHNHPQHDRPHGNEKHGYQQRPVPAAAAAESGSHRFSGKGNGNRH